ncbi:MAG: ABC transporter permease, partial [Janthinobacterium lividum]
MSTTAPVRPRATAGRGAREPLLVRHRPSSRTSALVAVLVVGVLAGVALRGRATLEGARSDLSPFQVAVNGLRDSLDASRGGSVLLQVLDGVAGALNALIQGLQHLVSDAPPGRPTPQIGWLGVVAVAVVVTLAVAGWRLAVLTALVFAAFGSFGYWQESLDTLIVTFVSVSLVLLVGLPLGIWMGTNRRVSQVVTPVLDVMQTLPSFVYLLPVTLFFGIGGAPAVIATFVYAFPPVVRVTAEGIRGVDTSVLEASESLGTTAAQRLLRVLLPMSRRTILVGVNQSVMAALSMVTIAAFINSPGLGVPVISALASLDVGTSFTAGVLVALAAVML